MQGTSLTPFEDDLATAILGLDTLWGGDVGSASGTGRFIADCYFSGKELPAAYTSPLAAALRQSGGLSAAAPDLGGARAYLAAFDLPGALGRLTRQAQAFPRLRQRYLAGLVESLQVMLDLARERLAEGPPVPYDRCVQASTGAGPSYVDPTPLREEAARLLAAQGEGPAAGETLLAAVDRWRQRRLVTRQEIAEIDEQVLPALEERTERQGLPHLPRLLRQVPRANVTFLPIDGAWFSGSMNYLGRRRTPEGEPEYEATYEINAAIELSRPELEALVAHEVVPGHVMTFALLQALQHRGRVGFEASIGTMNSRASTLYEGIANCALLLAYGVTEPQALPGAELQLGFCLSRLQDVAKRNASWLTYAAGQPPAEVAAALRNDCLVSPERADKLSGSWARHPLLGRLYLPSYDAGTRRVLDLLRTVPLPRLVPVLYGAQGLVDCVTIDLALADVLQAPPASASGPQP